MATVAPVEWKLDLPLVLVVFSIIVVAFPMARQKLAHGTLGFALHRAAHPLEPVIGAASAVLVLGIVAWAALYAVLGPEAVGVWREPAWVRAVGWLFAGAGTVVTAIAQRQMGSSWRIGIDRGETELVTRGLYRLVRNPIFSGCIVAAVGIGLLGPSAWSLAAVFVVVVLVSLQVRIEEDHLLKAHGRAYRAYAAKVGRLLPRIGRINAGG